jgi:hypothetical protein
MGRATPRRVRARLFRRGGYGVVTSWVAERPPSWCFLDVRSLGRAVPLLVATGCSTVPLSITPQELHHSVPALRQTGEAVVEVEPSGTRRVTQDLVLRASFPRASGWRHWFAGDDVRDLSVAQLIANCPDVPPFAGHAFHRNPPCLLQETNTERWVLDTEHRVDWEIVRPLGTVALTSVAVGGAVTCALECDGTPRNIAIGGFALLGGAVLTLYILSAYHKI